VTQVKPKWSCRPQADANRANGEVGLCRRFAAAIPVHHVTMIERLGEKRARALQKAATEIDHWMPSSPVARRRISCRLDRWVSKDTAIISHRVCKVANFRCRCHSFFSRRRVSSAATRAGSIQCASICRSGCCMFILLCIDDSEGGWSALTQKNAPAGFFGQCTGQGVPVGDTSEALLH